MSRYRPQPVPVPRRPRLTVNKRAGQEGNVRSPREEAKVLTSAQRRRDTGVGPIAVRLLWSFLAPGHERRAAGIYVRHSRMPAPAPLSRVLPGHRRYNHVARMRKPCRWKRPDRVPREHRSESMQPAGKGIELGQR